MITTGQRVRTTKQAWWLPEWSLGTVVGNVQDGHMFAVEINGTGTRYFFDAGCVEIIDYSAVVHMLAVKIVAAETRNLDQNASFQQRCAGVVDAESLLATAHAVGLGAPVAAAVHRLRPDLIVEAAA